MQIARPNQRIGRYEIASLIGQGTYSEVYRAKDTALKRDVALKVLRPGGVNACRSGTGSLQEAQVLAKLSHPNIVTVFDAFQSGSCLFIAMEYLSGGTLNSLNPQLSTQRMLELFRQVADAIAYAHGLGLIHGDIKPSNVAVSRDGSPKVIDFGLSKITGQASLMSTVASTREAAPSLMGTLPFMAPELMRGEPGSPLSDIFALGAVFYQMTYGEPAFSGPNGAAILNAVLSGELPEPQVENSELAKMVGALIKDMLDTDKSKRPSSMCEVVQRLSSKMSQPSERALLPKKFGAQIETVLTPFLKTGSIVSFMGIVGLGYGHNPQLPELRPSVMIMNDLEKGFNHLKLFGAKGQLTAAQNFFESVLLSDPENAAATAGLALTLLRKYTAENKDPALYNRALETARLALSLDSNLAISHLAMGQTLKQKGDYNQARSFLKHALILDPNNREAHIAIAFLDHRSGLTSQAIDRLERLSGQFPDSVEIIRPLAGFYYAVGHYAKAEQAFQQQISLNPDDSRAYSNLSAVQHLQGDTLKAISTLQQGLRIRPSRLLYSNLGTYLFFQKQYPQAVSAYEDALQLQGGTNDFRIWANLADAYNMVSGKGDLSRHAYQRAQQLLMQQYPSWKQDNILVSRVGLFQAKTGNFDAAEITINLVIGDGQATPDILFRAAVIKELVGKRTEALKLVETALVEGYPLTEIENEPELFSLRQTPEFHILQTRLNSENNT